MVWPAIIGAAAALAGGAMSGSSNRKLAHEQMDMQREFAQKGMQWRVADAKAAGVHPLAALGAQLPTSSPVAVGDTSMGQGLAQAGQDLSRAYEANVSRNEQAQAVSKSAFIAAEREAYQRARDQSADARADAALRSQLANDEAQRQYYYSQAARNSQQAQPPVPDGTAGAQGHAAGSIKFKPSEITSRDLGNPSQTAGSHPAWIKVESAPGVFRSILNPDLNIDAELAHTISSTGMFYDRWKHELLQAYGANRPRTFRQHKPSDAGPWYYDTGRAGYERYGVNRKGK